MSGYRPDNGFEGLMNLVRQELNEDTSQSTRTPAPQNVKTLQEPELDAEDVGMEDYSEEDLNKMPPQKAPKSKSKDDDRYSVREVPDSEVQNPAPKKESKLREKGWFYRVGDALREDVRFQKLVKRFGPTSDRVFRYVAQKEGTQTSKDLIQQLIHYATGVDESKIHESGPLYLCNNCYSTFRNVEAFCTKCRSNIVEKIVDVKEASSYDPKGDVGGGIPADTGYLNAIAVEWYGKPYKSLTPQKQLRVRQEWKRQGQRGPDDPTMTEVEEEDTSPYKRPYKNPEAIANAIAKAIGTLGYWHTETVSYSDREEYEFITTEGPKVIVSVKTEEQGD